jgi:hypothetical protein
MTKTIAGVLLVLGVCAGFWAGASGATNAEAAVDAREVGRQIPMFAGRKEADQLVGLRWLLQVPERKHAAFPDLRSSPRRNAAERAGLEAQATTRIEHLIAALEQRGHRAPVSAPRSPVVFLTKQPRLPAELPKDLVDTYRPDLATDPSASLDKLRAK